MAEPLENIEWKHWKELVANAWNPNVVFTPELRLLERSILLTGWVQPILASKEGYIIDGFHRWSLTRDSAAMNERWGGLCPVAVLDVPKPQAMILTVRMNRAKGSHVAARMADMVKELMDQHGMLREELAQEIGATLDEIDLLHQEGVFTHKDIANYRYSKAWVPKEVKSR